MKSSLRSRLILAFTIMLIGLLLLSALSLWALQRLNAQFQYAYEDPFYNYTIIADADISFIDWARSINVIVDENARSQLAEYERRIENDWKNYTDLLNKRVNKVSSQEGMQIITQIRDILPKAQRIEKRIDSLVYAGAYPAARLLITTELRGLMNQIEKLMGEDLDLQKQKFSDAYNISKNLYRNMIILIASIVVLVFAVCIFTIVIVYRLINVSISKIQEASQDISASSSEIVATTSELASNVVETGSAVNETTATVEQIRQTTRASTEKAKSVSEGAQKVTQIANNGRKVVEQSIETMRAIQQEMLYVGQSIMKLSEQSQAVGQIIDSVNELTERTNILSVNASIEAVKAGDQGKGFSVVAQEIRSLADQSKQATARIREILSDIQKATSTAVLIAEQAGKKVDQGMLQTANADEAIRVLNTSVNEAAQASSQISASNDQLLAGMDQMAEAINNVNTATHQNVTSTRQLDAAVKNLNDLGKRLNEVIEGL